MSQVSNLHHLFQMNGGKLTLGQILANWDVVGSKYTGRISELREELEKKGMTITCEEHRDRPTDNEYRIVKVVPMFDGKQAMLGLGA